MPRPQIPEFGEAIRPLARPSKPAPRPAPAGSPDRVHWKRELVSTSKLNKAVRIGFYVLIVLAFLSETDALFWIAVALGVIHTLTDKQLAIWRLHEGGNDLEPAASPGTLPASSVSPHQALCEDQPPAA